LGKSKLRIKIRQIGVLFLIFIVVTLIKVFDIAY